MLRVVPDRTTADALPAEASAKHLYYRLLQDASTASTEARRYLETRLRATNEHSDELPEDPQALYEWSRACSAQVGRRYREYLDARRAGAPRRFFSCKSHALYFLRGVAPTKMVDGAWLYGLLPHWRDERFVPLVRTYLEELGEGRPEQNHVVLYRQLLDKQGCADWHDLDDEHYVQGAIQLALAAHAEEFLPELIGYNLGYEQLPLHLLITSYELNELGIDPYYFTLHITIDNAASGHAQKAVQSVLEVLPQGKAGAAFYQRIKAGVRLNELGASTLSVIGAFDLQRELVRVLQAKAQVGAELHSDYCRIGGLSVNEWLREPARIPAFLRCLEEEGWIHRGALPEESRFWRLIEGERAAMFGVFSGYERQLLRDWIMGGTPREPSFRARQKLMGETASRTAPTEMTETRLEDPACAAEALNSKELAATLMALMSPAQHHTPAGLAATRRFAHLLQQR